MSDVSTSVDVHVPVRTAYNQWTQFESFPRFMAGVLEVRQLDDRHTHWVTEVGGKRREFDAEIVEQLPDERLAWRSIGGDVRHSGTVTFRSLGGADTRVTVDLAWEPRGVLEKAGGAVGVDRLQVKADLERFRRFLEERGTETGRWRGTITDPSKPPPGEDVVDVLVAQHRRIRDLMARISAPEEGDKERLFGEFVALLRTHEKGEQQVVHPVTRSRADGGDSTADARLDEEERAEDLLGEVEKLPAGSREFDTWFEHVRHAVLDHAEHEETEEFPQLRRELTPTQLRTMAEELTAVQMTRK